MNKKFLIVLHDKDTACKVMKIMFLHDGGFCFFMPYHTAKNGMLAKLRVDYSKFKSSSPFEEEGTYTADDDVKISYHPDGFVQFSTAGSKIISGRDSQTGKAKGLGIVTNPLTQLITTGPTFGGSLWGLQEFERFSSTKKD